MFEFDVQEAINQLRFCALLDVASGGATAFGVACVDGNNSHGVTLCAILPQPPSPDDVENGINKAIAMAMDLNQEEADNPKRCAYVPVGVGVPAGVMLEFLAESKERKQPPLDIPND